MYTLSQQNEIKNVPIIENQEVYSVYITQPVNLAGNASGTERPNDTTKATAKAGDYGGAELGSALANTIGCCCGGIIGNYVENNIWRKCC